MDPDDMNIFVAIEKYVSTLVVYHKVDKILNCF